MDMLIRDRKTISRLLMAAALSGLLAACATPFEARVQSFQQMPAIAGQSFAVVPADPRRQGSLEFQSYAALVSQQMLAKGFVEADPQSAYMLVKLDFGVGPANDRIGTRPAPVSTWGWYGRSWRHSPAWWGSFYDPFWGPGWTNELYSFTVYPTFLDMDIVRRADQVPLFEGRVESNTRVNDLPATMPKLVQAMFTDFPGQPARSNVVRVPTGS
jgi:hypothetical protein